MNIFLAVLIVFAGCVKKITPEEVSSEKKVPSQNVNDPSIRKPIKTTFQYKLIYIKNKEDISFFVPDPKTEPVNCNKINELSLSCKYSHEPVKLFDRLKDFPIKFPSKKNAVGIDKKYNILLNQLIKYCPISATEKEAYLLQEDCQNKKYSCTDINFPIGDLHYAAEAPLLDMLEWDKLYPDIPIKINTFAFQANGLTAWSYEMPCTNIIGEGKASNGNMIGIKYKNLPFDYLSIAVENNKSKLKFLSFKEMNERNMKNSQSVLSGLVLIKNGKYLSDHIIFSKKQYDQNEFKKIYRCFQKNGRIVLGVDKNNDLFILVVDNKDKETNGAKCEEAAKFLINIGAQDAIFFDGGASVNVLLKKDGEIIYSTPASAYGKTRPIPHFLGITPNKKLYEVN